MNEPIKVMHLIGGGEFFGKRLPIGGAAGYLFQVLDALPKDAYEHHVAFFYDGPSAQQARDKGYPVYILPKRFPKDPTLPLRLAWLLRKKKIELLHTHLTDADFYGRLAGRLARRLPVISTMHSFIHGSMAATRRKPLREHLAWWHEVHMAPLSRRITTVCHALEAELSLHGVEQSRLITIPPGVDTETVKTDGSAFREEIGLQSGDRLIGTVGRLVPAKNYNVFLNIAAGLLRKYDNLRFAIVGDGPQMDPLRKRAEDLGIIEQVIFSGWRGDMQAIFPAFDVFVLTSHTEAMPLTLIESMAARTPVVAPTVGGIPELVEHGSCGFLFEPGDADSAQKHLDTLLTDEDTRRKMGAAAARRIRTAYSLQLLGQRMDRLYRNLLPHRQ